MIKCLLCGISDEFIHVLIFYPSTPVSVNIFCFTCFFCHQSAPELPLNRKQASSERAVVNQPVKWGFLTGFFLAWVSLALTFSELCSPHCFLKGLKLLPLFLSTRFTLQSSVCVCVSPHTLLSLLGFIDGFRFSIQSISCSGGVSKVQ